MPITHTKVNIFQTCLDNSLKSLKDKDLTEYWMNRDGTVNPKTFWLGRIVRWFQNLFFDKTITDIWHVFTQAVEQYEESRKACFYGSSDNCEIAAASNNFASQRYERLYFATKFLISRKRRFDEWVKIHPEKLCQLENYINKYRHECRLLSELLEIAYLPSIDKKSLSKRPPSLNLAITPEMNSKEYHSLDIAELSILFEKIPLNNKSKKNEENLSHLIEKVKSRDEALFGINAAIHDKYYDQIELFLKNILYVICNDKTIPNQKIETVLTELAIAAGECGARWLEESKKQYRILSIKGISEFEAKVLEHIQAFKEDLFLELFNKPSTGFDENISKIEYHILDSLRKKYGKELGLDDSTVDLDVFTYPLPKNALEKLKQIFLEVYTPFKLIKGVTERINLELKDNFEPDYFFYLLKSVEKRFPNIEDPSAYVMEHYMGNESKTINEEGVLILLLEMKILKR